MQTIRDSSQQDRRVYIGNLSYDVKWHHLKDFMRQGNYLARINLWYCIDDFFDSWRGPFCRRFVTSEWNVEGGRQRVDLAGFLALFWFIVDVWIDGLDWSSVDLCRDAGRQDA